MHFLDKFILNKKPLRAIHKKIIVFSAVFLLFVFLTLIILFLPFKDGSTFENIVNEFYSKEWNSKTITQILLSVLTWILIIWNLTLRIMDTILYKKKKRAFEKELIKKGIYKEGEDKKIMRLNFKQHEQYVEITINKLLDACIRVNQPLKGAGVFTIREIINDINKSRKEKIEQVKRELTSYGINVENVEIARALKQI